eukprot:12120-Heterococcus_DN1.PRE.3
MSEYAMRANVASVAFVRGYGNPVSAACSAKVDHSACTELLVQQYMCLHSLITASVIKHITVLQPV